MKTGKCSFCGMEKEIISGKYGNICLDCCRTILDTFDADPDDDDYAVDTELKPHQIKAKLDQYIVGQEETKRILSVAVYNHYKREKIRSSANIQKSNILLIGPTGSGKTYIMQTLAKIMNVPFITIDATTLTASGFVGDDVSSILQKLYVKAEGNIEAAENGIVYIDEVDKLVSKNMSNNDKDINGTSVQQDFLKIIEGGDQNFQIGNPAQRMDVVINTDNILFVFSGAFIGIDKIVQERLHKPLKIGFGNRIENNKTNNENNEIIQEDIIKYGFIPEFIGRIPIILQINQLSKNELKTILTKPKDALLKQYRSLIRADGISVNFDNTTINYIVDEADKKKLGARGLRGIIDKPMNAVMFELPKYPSIKRLTITKNLLDNPQKELKKIANTQKQLRQANM